MQEHAQLPQLLRALNIAAEQDHIADLAVPDQFLKGFWNRVALKARYQALTRQQLHSFIDHRIFSLLRPLQPIQNLTLGIILDAEAGGVIHADLCAPHHAQSLY